MLRLYTSLCLLLWLVNPASAIEFKPDTKMIIDHGRRGEITWLYTGLDQYGHRFESELGVMWLDQKTSDYVRSFNSERNRTYTTEGVRESGLMAGGPGKEWSLSYRKGRHQRFGSCSATAVQGLTYTITCHDQRYDRPRGLTRTIIVDATTGMWLSRKTRNQASGSVGGWELIQPPAVVTE